MKTLPTLVVLVTAHLGCGASSTPPEAASDGARSTEAAATEAAATEAAATEASATEAAATEAAATEAVSKPKSRASAVTALEALGQLPEGLGVPVGEPAPTATVEDAEARAVELASTWSSGPVLLVFYRGGWCPYCNHQMYELTQAWPDLQARGVTPVAISVDRPDAAAASKASWEIPFPVLSDPDLRAHEAFKVVHQAAPEDIERLQGFGMDIEAASGRDHHRYAVPSVFLIDAEGMVRWAHVDPEYKVRPSTAQLLEVIDGAL